MKNKRGTARSHRKSGPARIAMSDVDLNGINDPLVVSELSETQNRSGRFRVAINGVTLGDLTLDFVAGAGVREGRILDRLQAVEILNAVDRTAVLDKALDLLAVRARSSRDLSIRLRRAGARDPDISWVVSRLESQGFVDDAAYARGVARAKALGGGVSRRKVITVLRQKGITADVAAEAMDATLADVNLDEYGAALAAAQKRVRALSSIEPAKQRQRLYAFLARRGYESDVVRRVVTEVLR